MKLLLTESKASCGRSVTSERLVTYLVCFCLIGGVGAGALIIRCNELADVSRQPHVTVVSSVNHYWFLAVSCYISPIWGKAPLKRLIQKLHGGPRP